MSSVSRVQHHQADKIVHQRKEEEFLTHLDDCFAMEHIHVERRLELADMGFHGSACSR